MYILKSGGQVLGWCLIQKVFVVRKEEEEAGVLGAC